MRKIAILSVARCSMSLHPCSVPFRISTSSHSLRMTCLRGPGVEPTSSIWEPPAFEMRNLLQTTTRGSSVSWSVIFRTSALFSYDDWDQEGLSTWKIFQGSQLEESCHLKFQCLRGGLMLPSRRRGPDFAPAHPV